MFHVIKLPYADRLSVVLEYRTEITVHVAVVWRAEDGHQVRGHVGDVMTPEPVQPHQPNSMLCLRFASGRTQVLEPHVHGSSI